MKSARGKKALKEKLESFGIMEMHIASEYKFINSRITVLTHTQVLADLADQDFEGDWLEYDQEQVARTADSRTEYLSPLRTPQAILVQIFCPLSQMIHQRRESWSLTSIPTSVKASAIISRQQRRSDTHLTRYTGRQPLVRKSKMNSPESFDQINGWNYFGKLSIICNFLSPSFSHTVLIPYEQEQFNSAE